MSDSSKRKNDDSKISIKLKEIEILINSMRIAEDSDKKIDIIQTHSNKRIELFR